MEGFDCEAGELESWIYDDDVSRRTASSHDFMTNYRECCGIVKTAGGEIL